MIGRVSSRRGTIDTLELPTEVPTESRRRLDESHVSVNEKIHALAWILASSSAGICWGPGHPRVRRVAAAGGGACKASFGKLPPLWPSMPTFLLQFAPLFRNSLHVEIEPVKERVQLP